LWRLNVSSAGCGDTAADAVRMIENRADAKASRQLVTADRRQRR
jgi:hypothetical protein